MRAARDRDTPTEMFVKDMHGNVGPPGMLAEAAPPTPAPKNIEPAQYPTMNLDIGPDASESTTVLLLPIGGAHSTPAGAPSRPGQPASHLSLRGVDGTLDPREGPADLSRAPSLSGIAAPTFGTPSQAFLAPQDPTGQGARGQSPQGQGAYPPFTGPPSFAGDAVPSTGSPRSIDVFMNRIGRSGNTLGAKALIQFRAATPGQQALVVGIAAGIGAVILVTLLFLIFF